MTDPRMTPTNDAPVTVEPMGPLWHSVQQVHDEAMRDNLTAEQYRTAMLAALASAPAGDGAEAERICRDAADRATHQLDRDYRWQPTRAHYEGLRNALRNAERTLARPRAAVEEWAFQIGDRVEKISGSSWRGKVVGTYSTTLTPEGYAVESDTETGSVQIYPAKALRLALQSPPAKVEE